MSPLNFRKKPVVIQAAQFTGTWESAQPILFWMREGWPCGVSHARFADTPGETPTLYIPTLEGTMEASPGDWIIRGVKGEYYPCKPDIFAATYDAITPELQHAA